MNVKAQTSNNEKCGGKCIKGKDLNNTVSMQCIISSLSFESCTEYLMVFPGFIVFTPFSGLIKIIFFYINAFLFYFRFNYKI